MTTTQSIDSATHQRRNVFPLLLVGMLFLFGAYTYLDWQNQRSHSKVEMKSSGKSGKHANTKSRQSASEKYQDAKTEFEKLNAKVNKSPEEKAALEKWKTQMKHWKKKKDWGGEQHSQKHKGN